MFGMSSEDFWENDPKLYWAYRTFYFKEKEAQYEQMRYDAWLKGSMNYMAVSYSLNNAFNKQKVNYPNYNELCDEANNKMKDRKLTKKEIDLIAQDEFNYWARR
jgi:hypothetical protein